MSLNGSLSLNHIISATITRSSFSELLGCYDKAATLNIYQSSVFIKQSLFLNNTGFRVGAIYGNLSSITFDSSRFEGNFAQNTSSCQSAAAIYILHAGLQEDTPSLSIVNCSIINNRGKLKAHGAIFVQGSFEVLGSNLLVATLPTTLPDQKEEGYMHLVQTTANLR